MNNRGILDAWEGLQFALWSYRVSIVGAQLTATADIEQIQTLIRMSKGFTPRDRGAPLHENAKEIQAAAQEEVGRLFGTYRKFVLVGACAAIENLWKATFVREALRNSSILTKVDTKLSLSASDVVSLSDEEKLFAVADELYKVCPSGRQRQRAWTHFDRHLYLVSKLLPLSDEEMASALAWLDAANSELFNEVFAVRNCQVHNGGTADRHLCIRGKFKLGQQIELRSYP